MVDEPIVITAAGAVSAIGGNISEMLSSLLMRRAGIGPIEHLKTSHREFPVGEVKLNDAEMVSMLGLDPDGAYTRTFLMGALALREAMGATARGLKPVNPLGLSRPYPEELVGKTAFICGTTVGGMDMSEQYYLDFLNNDTRDRYIATHDCGACTEMIAATRGSFGFVTTISTACSSAANAIMLGANMIRAGLYDRVIAGGSECITKYHLNGFNTLCILDRGLCRPFDQSRAGINLGEGAAFVILERESAARARGAEPLCRLTGWGNACDAYHQTATSPRGDGPYQAMSKALKIAGMSPADIDYINAHGTGTPNNDITEANAIADLFGDHAPLFSSTKAFTGHTTSASGAVELVISMLAMREGFLPVNLNWTTPMDDTPLRPVTPDTPPRQIINVMSNAFGFGGNDTSLIISAMADQPTVNQTSNNH